MAQGMGIDLTTNKYIKIYSARFMPLITVSMYPGRTQEQKEEFAKSVTESAVKILHTKQEHVIVVFDENPKENWFLAGKQL